ncbi:MAG: M48 family metallopeptidase [Lachnospiraceae bacterium]|nr:M48 family metallopeptidase [Lachnospiraceae bacterium]
MAYNAELYVHDLDRKAFAALNAFPKFVKLREAYITNFDEKAAKISFMSSAIRLSENQMPEIYNQLPPICEKLGIVVPELYYVKSKEINAATGGSSNPYIFVTSELVKKVPNELIPSVLAHECGHIACKHYLYHSMAMQLIEGIENSPLSSIPGIRRFLTPTLIKALLFWDRCSELSADRAAVLCDGKAENMVDALLKIHGYSNNINRDEFIKQALDLKAFVNDSKSNQLIEAMLTQGDTHPRLATRAYECYEFSKSDQYQGILDGSYTIDVKKEKEAEDIVEEEIVAADISLQASGDSDINIDAELERVNKELKRYTCEADKVDYAFAVFSGIMAGAIDAIFIGETKITGKDIGLSHQQVNNFIQEYAKSRGFDRARLKDSISDLEQAFKVAQDNLWKGAGIGVSAKNHHLADLAHHPTPVGLVSSIVVQFLRLGSFVNKDGEWHFIFVETTPSDIIQVLAPAVITGILNWLVAVAEKKYEEESGEEVPKALHRLSHLVASTPIIVEIAKCADNWFGHLVSDMGGSKNTAGGGMGIPGIFVSLLYEISALPILKDSGLPAFVDDLYENHKLDLRHEITMYKALGKQAIPVALNEIYVRLGFFVSHLCVEIADHKGLKGIDWSNVIPFRNRTVKRMITISSMTFTVADTADAAVHAALESGGNWVLFAGRFAARFNYVGAGRSAVAIVKEISNERKEAQLIHEKMILTEAKTIQVMQVLEEYKAKLTERVSDYLAQDIEAFIEGFDYMKEGLATGNSDLVIKGNVVIQRVLGREPQFTNQEEFDALMDSDIALQL